MHLYCELMWTMNYRCCCCCCSFSSNFLIWHMYLLEVVVTKQCTQGYQVHNQGYTNGYFETSIFTKARVSKRNCILYDKTHLPVQHKQCNELCCHCDVSGEQLHPHWHAQQTNSKSKKRQIKTPKHQRKKKIERKRWHLLHSHNDQLSTPYYVLL